MQEAALLTSNQPLVLEDVQTVQLIYNAHGLEASAHSEQAQQHVQHLHVMTAAVSGQKSVRQHAQEPGHRFTATCAMTANASPVRPTLSLAAQPATGARTAVQMQEAANAMITMDARMSTTYVGNATTTARPVTMEHAMTTSTANPACQERLILGKLRQRLGVL